MPVAIFALAKPAGALNVNVGRKKPDLPAFPAQTVAALRRARAAMIEMQMEVRAFGPAYLAAQAVTGAIDKLATLLTGEERYFRCDNNSTPGRLGTGCGPLGTQAEKREREEGRAPWRRADDL